MTDAKHEAPAEGAGEDLVLIARNTLARLWTEASALLSPAEKDSVCAALRNRTSEPEACDADH